MTTAVRACIGLGANLGCPVDAVLAAFTALDGLPGSRLLARSRLFRTPAWGGIDQPEFVNAAALLETRLAPLDLLRHLLDIERRAGRDRSSESAAPRWGPRVLDLDLLLYGAHRIDEPGLRVPHPHLHERAFALVPLADIAAGFEIPGHGRVADALSRTDASGIVPMTMDASLMDEVIDESAVRHAR